MKIVITDSATVSSGDLSFDFLNRYGEVTAYGLTSPEQVAERIADADMVLCNKTPINRQTVGKAETPIILTRNDFSTSFIYKAKFPI